VLVDCCLNAFFSSLQNKKIKMELADFNTATGLQRDIAEITAIQAALATSGAKVLINVVAADGKTLLESHEELFGILGSAYTTICSTALTSLGTQLSSLKTTKQTAFDGLGD
jgi:hypothetical protein